MRVTWRMCSSPFTPRSRKAAGSASPSCTGWRRITEGPSTCGRHPRRVASLPSACPDIMTDARILVADDERSMRELLAIMPRQGGHDVTLAEGGQMAIDALRGEAFDLIITDLRMQKVDGMAVLRAAREHSPDTQVLVI